MAAYRRVYDSRHLQAVCQEPRSAPEPHARQSSTGYLYPFLHGPVAKCRVRTLFFFCRQVRGWFTNNRRRFMNQSPLSLRYDAANQLYRLYRFHHHTTADVINTLYYPRDSEDYGITGVRPAFRFIVRKTLTYLRRAYVTVYRYSLEVFPVSRPNLE